MVISKAPLLLPCDIFFTRGEGFVSNAIRALTQTKGESRTVANHVGLVGYQGEGLLAWGIEALATVKFHPLHERYAAESQEICVFRPMLLSEIDKQEVLRTACSYIGRKYGYLKIAAHALDRAIGGKYFFRRLCFMDRYPICSWLTDASYGTIGIDFATPAGESQPDDQWDWIMWNLGKQWQFIWQKGNMYEKANLP